MHYVPSMATATDLSVPSSDSSTSPGRVDLMSMFLRLRKSFISFCVVERTINAFSNMMHVVMIKHPRDLLFIMLAYLIVRSTTQEDIKLFRTRRNIDIKSARPG